MSKKTPQIPSSTSNAALWVRQSEGSAKLVGRVV